MCLLTTVLLFSLQAIDAETFSIHVVAAAKCVTLTQLNSHWQACQAPQIGLLYKPFIRLRSSI